MNCDVARERITAYLDGELDETTASSLRGHLRTCAACRRLGEEHARIVDALASLAAPEPPRDPEMWGGIKARLGAAEIEDSKRSRAALLWRRVRPQLVPAFGLAAAATVAGVWIVHRRGGGGSLDGDERPRAPVVATGSGSAAPTRVTPAPTGAFTDVAEDLRGDDARADASYRAAAEELIAMASDARAEWPEPQARTFEARLDALRAAVDHAPLGQARERAWQSLIDYVQRAVVGVRIAEAR